MLHILLIQESDKTMSTRLIIDGNAVYEIDEDCEACMRRKNEFPGRVFRQEKSDDGEMKNYKRDEK